VGKHRRIETRALNLVRLVRFNTAGEIESIAEDYELVRWDAQGRKNVLLDLKLTAMVRAVAISRDWLAAWTTMAKIIVRSLAGSQTADIGLPDGQFPRALAFSPDGKQLAVGIGSAVPNGSFFIEADETVAIFEVGAVAKKTLTLNRPGRAEAMA